MPDVAEPRPVVLVVDDDDMIRRLVRLALCQRFTVLEASSAIEAIDMVGRLDVEVVIIDVMMPGMTGIEACPVLKAKALGPLPVLLLTALDDQENLNRGLEGGADDYLTKPFDRQELVLRVHNFVRMRRQEQLIRKQLESLSQLQALKDDLTALLVHDLRNPLTGVRSALQLLEPNIREEDRDLLLLGQHALTRVMDGVSDLLKVRMLEQGQLPLEAASVPVDALVHSAVETMKTAALEGKIDVRVSSTGNVWAQVDSKLINRALENLLINAFRHTRFQVDVEVAGTEQYLTVSVSDRGPGVPDFLKDELFDRFGSLALHKAGGRRGHGLGLYLVRLVAKAHGGDVQVKDRPGGGASFVITLPRVLPTGTRTAPMIDAVPDSSSQSPNC
jgi:two-component system sensor histidine kinase/response regulator